MTKRKSTGRYLIMFNNFKTTGKVQVKPVLLGFKYLESFFSYVNYSFKNLGIIQKYQICIPYLGRLPGLFGLRDRI